MVVILIGPMGCGKSTIGRLLAARLGWPFDDADEYHPPANIAKMQAGTPLTDEDRLGWLQTLAARITARLAAGEDLVLACSALKKRYRELLGVDQERVLTVYLKGEKDLLAQRIAARNHPFMNADLLDSQLATMEEPAAGLSVDIAQTPEKVVALILTQLRRSAPPPTSPRPLMQTSKHDTPRQTDIAIVGLAVMGENLVLNLADKGYSVSVYNRTAAKVDGFLAGRALGKPIYGYHAIADLVASLKRPRKVMMMLKAGAPVDACIEQLLPYLEMGDIVIDGGNSLYHDTVRRTRRLEDLGLLFIGTGVSGGEEGALKGPSIMPGGSPAAWPHLEKIFTAIAAKADDGEPCCSWMGADGAGHFVKMVHNGIEYGDMQLICEAYQVLRNLLALGPDQLQPLFAGWNQGDLQSYLIEITAAIFAHREQDGRPTVDLIRDTAGQKGTGKWTVEAALDYGVPLSLISESVFARCLSAGLDLRLQAGAVLAGPTPRFTGDAQPVLASLERALYCAKVISYTQGFALLGEASQNHGWNLDCAAIARLWRGGCIIRSRFLDRIAAAYRQQPHLANLLLAPAFAEDAQRDQQHLRTIVGLATAHGIAVPCFSAALAYYDGLRTTRLPANLLQAQRDYFGAHTYERLDRPRGEFFHTDWTGCGGSTTSTAYTR